ncbi:MAG: magnesium transporter [Chloroflexota bacterium]
MVFLSDLLNEAVYDSQGRKIGSLRDLVVSHGELFPTVVALAVAVPAPARLPARETLLVPWRYVVGLEEPRLSLNVPKESIKPYVPRNGELFLSRDVLDKQIVDTQGRRIVKVNDLKLAQVKGVARLLGADISFQAFLRRLVPFKVPERLVTWNYVEPLEAEAPSVKLTVPHSKLRELHPADLADLIEQMKPEAGTALLESLDVETAADALQEVESPYQADLVEELDSARASDLLEAMPVDQAADIIGDLSQEKAQEILSLMEEEPAQEVKDLLQYGERTAGGRMSTDVLMLKEDLTAEQAIEQLRLGAPEAETTYYLFITDREDHLVGVVSLRRLVTASPKKLLRDIMDRNVIKVNLDTDQEEVARVMAKYSLLAVPVVDERDRLRGMVTVDDVLEVVHEEANEDISQMAGTTVQDVQQAGSFWRAALGRFAWLSATLVGGVITALVMRNYSQSIQSLLALAYFIPLLLAVGASVGGQSLAVVSRGASTGAASPVEIFWKELGMGSIAGVVAGLAVALVAYLWLGTAELGLVVGASLAVTLVSATFIGAVLPLMLKALHLDPTLAAGPVVDPIIGVISVVIYLGLASRLLSYAIL